MMPGGGLMAVMRTAACLAVGSELLGDRELDGNSLIVARVLARYGVTMTEKRVVGDVVEQIARAVAELLERVDVVVVTGGLGPTVDDVTRAAVARGLGRELHPDAEVEGWIRERYVSLGRTMPELCRSMALVVDGSRPVRNTCGSAPGLVVEVGGRMLAVLPGVPHEMELMLERDLLPELERRAPGLTRRTRTLLLGGVMESEVEGRIGPLWERFGRDRMTILASPGVVRLLLQAVGSAADVAEALDGMEAAFRDALGDDVAGVEVAGLQQVVVGRLLAAGATLAAAESCTGGLLSARVTDLPGASGAFLGGVVCYSNAAKERLVGVPRALLETHGAVSEPVALALASGVRERFGADWGVGITGIAGPGGGTPDKPVGLVHWAVAGPGEVAHQQRVFGGSRAVVREWSVNAALDLLRRMLGARIPHHLPLRGGRDGCQNGDS
jgi:nicotinamide-nucleotide amidase